LADLAKYLKTRFHGARAVKDVYSFTGNRCERLTAAAPKRLAVGA